jgi:hypothetical protein
MIKSMTALEKEVIEVDQHIRQRRKEAFDNALNAYKSVGWIGCGQEQKCADAKAKMIAALETLENCAR